MKPRLQVPLSKLRIQMQQAQARKLSKRRSATPTYCDERRQVHGRHSHRHPLHLRQLSTDTTFDPRTALRHPAWKTERQQWVAERRTRGATAGPEAAVRLRVP